MKLVQHLFFLSISLGMLATSIQAAPPGAKKKRQPATFIVNEQTSDIPGADVSVDIYYGYVSDADILNFNQVIEQDPTKSQLLLTSLFIPMTEDKNWKEYSFPQVPGNYKLHVGKLMRKSLGIVPITVQNRDDTIYITDTGVDVLTKAQAEAAQEK